MDLKSYIKMELDGVSRNADRVLKDLTQADISWRPAAGCNSMGLILYHCARSEDHFISEILTGKEQIYAKWCRKMDKPLEDGGAHYTVEQVNSFVVPPMQDILDYWAEVRKASIAYVDSLSEADFDKKIALPFGEFSVAGVLSLTVSHAAGHIGEISYLRGLYRGMDK